MSTNPFAAAAPIASNPTASNPFAVGAAGGAPGQMVVAGAGGFAPPANQAQRPSMDQQRAALIDEVDFDSDVKSNSLDRFQKMKKDERTRISPAIFNEKGGPRFKSVQTFSFGWNTPGAQGVSFIAPKDPELLRQLTEKFGQPKLRLGTIIVHYDTDPMGNMLPNGGYKLEAFTIGVDKFNLLKARHGEWPLTQHDLVVTCTEPAYQKLDFQPARECLWRAAPDAVKGEITSRAQMLYDSYLDRMMGFVRSDDELRYLLQYGQFPASANAVPTGPTAAPAGAAVNPFAPQPTPQTIAEQAGVGGAGTAAFADLAVAATNETPAATEEVKAAAPAEPTIPQTGIFAQG